MEALLRFLKNYKKHPVLATIVVLLLLGAGIWLFIQAQKTQGSEVGPTPMVVTVTPTGVPDISPTDTPEPATPTPEYTATPTLTPAVPTPTQAAKPTKTPTTAPTATPTPTPAIDENGSYYSKKDVALYIHTYGHLPGNFITKKEAEALGWTGGSVERYAKGKAIGGDSFGNYEGKLPKKNGRKYYECDIDTKGAKSRGAKRIIFSNDGLIFYTDDHYENFEQLY